MVFVGLLVFAFPVLAQIVNPLPGITSFGALFGRIISALAGVVAAVGVIMLIISGIFYMTSAGSTERIGVAKKTLTYAIIGIVVGIGYQAIIGIIKGAASNTLSVMLNNMKGQLLLVVGSLCAAMITVSGIFYLISAGSPEKAKVARTALIYTVVGTAIALGATMIYSTIVSLIS